MFHGEVSKEIAQGLIELQARIKTAQIPSSKLDETINIATWNIREFGKVERTEAAIHYIAEILGQFDLIGVVELRDDLNDLGRVLTILGPYWRAVYSDMIPDSGGNRERTAFLYDKRAVTFGGFAAEANPPRKKVGNEYISEISFWRSPYMASFHAGNFDFVVLSAHIRWGDDEIARKGELQLLADWVDEKRKEKTHEDKDMIVMGDFNIADRDDDLYKAIISRGLVIPQALRQLSFGTNLARNKHYDQIFHHPIYPENFTNQGGVLDFYAGDVNPLFPGMSLKDFTYQLSDHLPLWMQVNTDIDGHQLDEIIRG
ncbi:MAG: endonuclease/exonuclease/phosphatase family protein [Terriglobia bacterium]